MTSDRRSALGFRFLRTTLAACVFVVAQVPGLSNGAARIHLKGRTRIEAHAARYSGEIALAGTVIDDTGMAASLPVTLTLSRPGARSGGEAVGRPSPLDADVALTTAAPASCASDPRRPLPSARAFILVESATRLVVPSDAEGKFCVRLLLPTDRYVAHLVAAPSPVLDGTSLDVPFDVAAKPVALMLSLPFASQPETALPELALDEATSTVDAVATTDADGTSIPLAGLTLHLANETGAPLGDATTDVTGRGRLVVAAALLGPAGRGQLKAVFDGRGDVGPGASTLPVERRTHVRLFLPDARGGVLAPGWPGDGITVKVRAIEECATYGCLGTPSGVVEARVSGARIGAGALVDGEARLELTFAPPSGAEANLEFEYLADAPWFLAAEPLLAVQPVRAPMPWARLLTGLAGAAVLVWFVWTRARPVRGGRRVGAGTGKNAPPLQPTARLIIRDADPGASGWRGVVIDAHDGCAVAGAIVSIERRAFDRATVLASASSDVRGAFVLPFVAPGPGDELVVRSGFHVNFRSPLPPRGSLEVAVTLRKRALIEGLAAWARRKGGTYDLRPDATPGHVRAAAGARPDVSRWADAVERAAFGPDPVDARAHSDVDILAPPDARRPPQEEDAIDIDHVDGPRSGSV
jgi:hypothetical protein